MSELNFRNAEASDAPFLSKCVTEVAQGVVEMLLDGYLPGVSPEQILTMVLQDTSQALSYKNCLLALQDLEPKGVLLAYASSEQVIPSLMRTLLPAARLKPLESVLTAVWNFSLYINTLWVANDYRGSGLADALIDYAKSWAKELNFSRLSLMVLADNLRAKAFYKRNGFKVIAPINLPDKLKQQHGGADLLGCEF